MNIFFRGKLVSALAWTAASILPLAAGGQEAPRPPPAAPEPTVSANGGEPQKLEPMVVTGSNIPTAAEALAIPVATLDFRTMEDSGVNSDMLDIMRKVAPNISGIGEENAQLGFETNFGGASATLKGLPTLVLINGRRVANDPAEATGGNNQFVDLNLIPPAAIDRIEVLQDGASAIYGSDAIGGVINIILKKNYNGWEFGTHFGYSANTGHYEERSDYLVGGVSTPTTSITVAADYAQHDAIFLASRPYTNPIYGTYTFPGSIELYNNLTGADDFYQLAPGLNAPPTQAGGYTIQQLVSMGVYVPKTATQQFQTFNLANAETLSGYLKRYSAMIDGEHHVFGDSLVGFADILAAHSYTWSQLNAQPVVPYLEDPWIDVNVLGSTSPPPAGTTFVPVTAPGNPFSPSFLDQNQSVPESGPGNGDGSGYEILAHNRFLAYPRIYQNDSDLYRIVGGLRGDAAENLHWEAAANLNRYTLDYTNPGVIGTIALNNALADGQINPFAITQAPGAFNGVVGTAFVNMLSTLTSFDAKVNGTPLELPGGKLAFALGGSYEREGLSAVPDVNSLPNSSGTTQGWSDGLTFENFNASRNVSSAFGELSLPLTGPGQHLPGAHAINLDAAVRYDDYSGSVGGTTNPQVNLSWAPIDDQVKFRASAGKSFIAPQLYQLYGPVSAGETPSITYNTAGGGQNTAEFLETSGSNPNLKPTTADTWTAGFVFTPKAIAGFSLTVDYSDISEKQIVNLAPPGTIVQSVELQGLSSPYVNLVHFNSPTGPTVSGPGGISSRSPQQVYVIDNDTNLSGQQVDSTDFVLEYVWVWEGFGRFDLASSWTWYRSYQLQLVPTEPDYEYSGTASTNEATVPKWRTYTTLDWSKNGANVFVGLTYVSAVTDVGVGGDDQFGLEGVAAFTAFDLGLSYRFKDVNRVLDGLKITLGANNLFNRLPPLAPNAFPNTNTDLGTYDGAIGRMCYVNASYSF